MTPLDSLRSELQKARTTHDSVTIMFNIHDCTPFDKRVALLDTVYNLSLRDSNYIGVRDALYLLSGYYSDNDSMQNVLVRRAESLPDSDIKKSMLLYLRMRRARLEIMHIGELAREQRMLQYLAEYRDRNWQDTDIYDRIENLFLLCLFLRSATEGDLLTSYLLELSDLIDKLPASDLSLRTLFFTQASRSFLNNGMYEEAADANRARLDVIDQFDKLHASLGRIYRNYDGSLHATYLTLLLCYRALSDEEIEKYYNNIVKIEKRNEPGRFSEEVRRRGKIYYLMAKKRYAEALPLIKEQIKVNTTPAEHVRLIECLLDASRELNNREDLLYALDESNRLLKERLQAKTEANFRDLQIIHEVQDLRRLNAELAHDNQVIINNRQRAATIITIIGLILVTVLLLILWHLYRKAHKLSLRLTTSNKMLIGERDALKEAQRDLIDARDKAKAADRVKTEFVNNISHEIRTPLAAIVEYSNLISDCADGDTRPYIKRFADVVSLNADLVFTLVNDVLEIPDLENAKMSVRIIPTSVKDICLLAVANVEKRLKPDVQLIFTNADDPDAIIRTDPQRVGQILLNLLSNAAKFTEKGTITFSYSIDNENNRAFFVVTDTGIGIPRGKEEVIFSRFEKLNSQTQGNGLGLYIARLLADLLKGRLYLDPTYRRGARFVLEIPTE